MTNLLKAIIKRLFGGVKYSVTGNGVVHVRPSDLLKTEKARATIASIKNLNID